MVTSCNGCRILRKGCNDNCLLRQSLTLIDSPQSQSHATLFLSKFFGRAPLLSFLSAAPLSLRPILFQSLLYEACGRTINPITGAVGLMATGNWTLCKMAVDTVLRGENLTVLPIKGFLDDRLSSGSTENNVSDRDAVCVSTKKRKFDDDPNSQLGVNLDLQLMTDHPHVTPPDADNEIRSKRARTVSHGSEMSGTTSFSSEGQDEGRHDLIDENDDVNGKTLTLFY